VFLNLIVKSNQSMTTVSNDSQIVYIKKVIDHLSNNNANNYINELIDSLPRPIEIEPFTVGAFMFGCFQETHGDIPSGCSLVCLNGLAIKNNSCKFSIWTYDNNKLRPISIENSSNGYLFVDENFEGLSRRQINILLKHRVQMVTLVITRNGKHFLHHQFKGRSIKNNQIYSVSSKGVIATEKLLRPIDSPRLKSTEKNKRSIRVIEYNSSSRFYSVVMVIIIIVIITAIIIEFK
jgi:hypothetical protein